jgi:hypothetical protein
MEVSSDLHASAALLPRKKLVSHCEQESQEPSGYSGEKVSLPLLEGCVVFTLKIFHTMQPNSFTKDTAFAMFLNLSWIACLKLFIRSQFDISALNSEGLK